MRNFKILILFVLVTACNFNANVNYKNENTEKEAAESVIGLFYLNLERNEFQQATGLFSNSIYKESKQELVAFLKEKKDTLGNFKDYSLKDWSTSRIQGANAATQYVLVYDVRYSKENAVESFSMVKENDSIKIVGYDVKKLP